MLSIVVVYNIQAGNKEHGENLVSFRTWDAEQDLMSNEKAGLEWSALSPGQFLIHYPLSIHPGVVPGHTIFWNLNKWCLELECHPQLTQSAMLLARYEWPLSDSGFKKCTRHFFILRLPNSSLKGDTYKAALDYSKAFSSILFQTYQVLFTFRLSHR